MGLSDRLAVLDNGVIQQCDTPNEVYRNPATVFVGRFIGSPPMNILECSVRKSDPLEVDCHDLVLSKTVKAGVMANNVVIGIRPEDMLVRTGKQQGSIEGTVLVVEPAGSFNWVEIVWKGTKLRGISNSEEKLQPGRTAYMTFSLDKVSLFDGISGKRL
jgi:multiple sugar transport system ATP-binding protein